MLRLCIQIFPGPVICVLNKPSPAQQHAAIPVPTILTSTVTDDSKHRMLSVSTRILSPAARVCHYSVNPIYEFSQNINQRFCEPAMANRVSQQAGHFPTYYLRHDCAHCNHKCILPVLEGLHEKINTTAAEPRY